MSSWQQILLSSSQWFGYLLSPNCHSPNFRSRPRKKGEEKPKKTPQSRGGFPLRKWIFLPLSFLERSQPYGRKWRLLDGTRFREEEILSVLCGLQGCWRPELWSADTTERSQGRGELGPSVGARPAARPRRALLLRGKGSLCVGVTLIC